MDEQTRKDVDAACLRLMGYEQHPNSGWYEPANVGGWYLPDAGDGSPSPSADSALVVPLAEALRARGWLVQMIQVEDGWAVDVRRLGAEVSIMEYADTLPLALAKAAARAVGTENDK